MLSCMLSAIALAQDAPVGPPEAPPAPPPETPIETPPPSPVPAVVEAPVPPAPVAAAPVQTFPSLANPAISLNGLFVAGVEADDGALVGLPPGEDDPPDPAAPAGKGETFGTGLAIQELEIQLRSAIDPYLDANVIFAIPGGEGIEVEEGYVQWKSIPRVLVKAGKFKETFGRENALHAHALRTIDRSLVAQRVFGGEGLDDVGVNAAILMPLPWYLELTVGADAGGNANVLGSGDPLGLGATGHVANLFDLADATTLELGLSGLTGRNAHDGRSVVAGADLTLKSRGHGRHMWRRFVWTSEGLYRNVAGADEDERLAGLYSTVEVAFSRRVWLGGRFDAVAAIGADPTFGGTLIGVYAPSEFSAVRLQAQRQVLPDGHVADSAVLQLNFTIGSHPAHTY